MTMKVELTMRQCIYLSAIFLFIAICLRKAGSQDYLMFVGMTAVPIASIGLMLAEYLEKRKKDREDREL